MPSSESKIAALTARPDSAIDYSDIPKLRFGRTQSKSKFYRPAKTSVTIRLDSDIIAWLKGYGPGYQTRVNGLLRHAMRSSVGDKTARKSRWIS